MHERRSFPLHPLPAPLTSLVGREREVSAVCALLSRPGVRFVTLTGTGGVGKTRLALEVAARVTSDFADGACFVALAPITEPGLVVSTIAGVLGVREQASQPLLESLKDSLREKQLLLVLDNFEQILSAAPVVVELLLGVPALKVLVTSRASLHLSGEYEFVVAPLSLPDLRDLPPLDRLEQSEAVRLFVERAQAVTPDFALSEENAAAIAAICHQVDGLPLAIELAAGRVKLLSPQALLPRLRDRLKLLVGGAQDLPARQQTLRATISWSYDLLDQHEQALFRRLAVFVGGCTLAAAEAVCAPSTGLEGDMLDSAARLVDQSLLRQGEQGDGEPRFLMLETIRDYALERLTASGEAEAIERQHAAFFLTMAEEAEPELWGREQAVWLKRLETEYDNLRAALGRSLSAGEGEIAARLAGALWQFWWTHSHFSEGRRWLDAILANHRSLSTSAQLKVLFGAGILARDQGDYKRARALYEEALTLQRTLGNKEGIAELLSYLGLVAVFQGDYEQAAELSEESLVRYRELDNERGVALSLQSLALAVLLRGEYERAAALSEESIIIKRKFQDRFNLDLYTLYVQAAATMLQGDYERAIQACREALMVSQDQENKNGLAYGLIVMAAIAGAQGQPHRAAQLFGAAEALQDAIGTLLPLGFHPLYESVMVNARDQLGEAAFAERRAQGRAMPLAQALAEAEQTALSEQVTSTRSALSYPAGLSRREVEVLRLAAAGFTDAQIAEKLVLSPRTINTHLQNIYKKLEVHSRYEATHFAVEHHLILTSSPSARTR